MQAEKGDNRGDLKQSLAFRFCSYYFAAYGLWTTLDFRRESAIMVADGRG
jgi:hypothetical protein